MSKNTPTIAYAPVQGRPVWAPTLEAGGIAIWVALWLSFARRFANGPSPGGFLVLAALFCGIVASDAMSGFLHWFFDTFLDETTPVIGAQLVAPFREHHRDPLAMTRHGFLEMNGNNCTAFLPFMMTVWCFGPVEPRSYAWTVGYLFVLTFCFTLTATNKLHSWAHDPDPPPIGRWLQQSGLTISPAHHAHHHVPPHCSRYCVTTGWVNYVADRLLLFEHAERILVALGVPRKASS